MGRIEGFLEKRKEILRWYREALGGVAGLALNPRAPWAEAVNWMVCARLDGTLAHRRDGALADLRASGVDTRPFFVPLAEMPPYRRPTLRQIALRMFDRPKIFLRRAGTAILGVAVGASLLASRLDASRATGERR